MKTFNERYEVYRRHHGALRAWTLACDPFQFMIVWPVMLGVIAGLLI